MESLVGLRLDNNPNLSDLAPLTDCPSLERLSLVDTAVSDLSFLLEGGDVRPLQGWPGGNPQLLQPRPNLLYGGLEAAPR